MFFDVTNPMEVHAPLHEHLGAHEGAREPLSRTDLAEPLHLGEETDHEGMAGQPARAGAAEHLRVKRGAHDSLLTERVGLGAAMFRAHDGDIVCGSGVSTRDTRQRERRNLEGETSPGRMGSMSWRATKAGRLPGCDGAKPRGGGPCEKAVSAGFSEVHNLEEADRPQ
jgi:hypothetical protein